MTRNVPQCETKFSSLVNVAAADYNQAIEDIVERSDILGLEIYANFTEMFN